MLQSRLRAVVSEGVAEQLASSTHSLESLGLNADQRADVLNAYMQGIRIIFIVYAPLIGICALGCIACQGYRAGREGYEHNATA